MLTAEGMKAPPRPPKAAPQQEEVYDDLAGKYWSLLDECALMFIIIWQTQS